jgi:hypothetical protein
VLLLAAPEALEVKGKVLIVDETEELVTSIRLEAMARILIEHGFSVKAILGFPEETVEAGPFDLVFVIPRESEYIWLCVPPEAEANGVNETELVGLKELVVKVFGGERELRTPADDLWPLLLSLRLAALGIFGDV